MEDTFLANDKRQFIYSVVKELSDELLGKLHLGEHGLWYLCWMLGY